MANKDGVRIKDGFMFLEFTRDASEAEREMRCEEIGRATISL